MGEIKTTVECKRCLDKRTVEYSLPRQSMGSVVYEKQRSPCPECCKPALEIREATPEEVEEIYNDPRFVQMAVDPREK
jgi:hypothetical protein